MEAADPLLVLFSCFLLCDAAGSLVLNSSVSRLLFQQGHLVELFRAVRLVVLEPIRQLTNQDPHWLQHSWLQA